MRTLVVTGGIGSGKSTVCRLFASKGIPVYDSDSRTRQLYDSDRDLVCRIEAVLGCRISDAGGCVDRRRLAEIVFSSPARLAALESVVHPAVKEDFIRWRESFQDNVPFVVMESAIILEKPLFCDIADKVLLVDAPLPLRLDRACSRDGAAPEQVKARMERQALLNDISEGRVRPDADYVIINDKDIAALVTAVDRVYRLMCVSAR